FPNASVCLVHGMSRPLGAVFDIPHGVSNAMLLKTVLNFNKEKIESILGKVGDIVVENRLIEDDVVENMSRSDIGLYKITKMIENLNIPTISEWGVNETEFKESLDKMTKDAFLSGSPQNNPVIPNDGQIKELYLNAFKNKEVNKL